MRHTANQLALPPSDVENGRKVIAASIAYGIPVFGAILDNGDVRLFGESPYGLVGSDSKNLNFKFWFDFFFLYFSSSYFFCSFILFP